jgi:ATP-dependent 26S proteasome regulatory subunit
MIIFTTNHIDHIDPAVIRSGRIDFHQEFKKASVNIIKEMVSNIRNIDCTNPDYESYFGKMADYTLSPADIQNICFKYTNNDAIQILNEITDLSISKHNYSSFNNPGIS